MYCIQGDTDASEFFVLETGVCEVYVARASDPTTAKKVLTYGPGRCVLSMVASLSLKSSPLGSHDMKRAVATMVATQGNQ